MKKIIPCENCGRYTIEIDEIGGTMIVKRGFTGKKGAQYQQCRIIYLTKNCPDCGAYHGEKKFNPEGAIKRLHELGIDKIVTVRK